MEQTIQLAYINEAFQIGLVNWKEAWLLGPTNVPLFVEYYKGAIVYRQKGASRRIYYKTLKTGLKKTNRKITIQVPDWL